MANISLTLLTVFGGSAAALALAGTPAAAQCQLCAAAPAAAKRPPASLSIEVTAGIDFARIGLAALNQGGTATIDPLTGQRTLTGSLVSLAGIPVQGAVTIRGGRNEQLTVTLPSQVTLSTSGGGTVQLTQITTTLKQSPKLNQDGILSFTFGGRLLIDGTSDGDFRANIPITVDYR